MRYPVVNMASVVQCGGIVMTIERSFYGKKADRWGIGTKDKIYGYVRAKFLELMMSAYHFAKDKYLSYASPQTLKAGRSATC